MASDVYSTAGSCGPPTPGKVGQVVADHQQEPMPSQGGGRAMQHRGPLVGEQVQVGHQHHVVRGGLGLVAAQVRQYPVHADTSRLRQPPSLIQGHG